MEVWCCGIGMSIMTKRGLGAAVWKLGAAVWGFLLSQKNDSMSQHEKSYVATWAYISA